MEGPAKLLEGHPSPGLDGLEVTLLAIDRRLAHTHEGDLARSAILHCARWEEDADRLGVRVGPGDDDADRRRGGRAYWRARESLADLLPRVALRHHRGDFSILEPHLHPSVGDIPLELLDRLVGPAYLHPCLDLVEEGDGLEMERGLVRLRGLLSRGPPCWDHTVASSSTPSCLPKATTPTE